MGVPQGPVYKTTDGGVNWTAQTSNADSSLQSIFFTDANTGYDFGAYDILKTTDGGTTWIRSNNNHPNFDQNTEHLEMYCTDANTCYIPGAVIQKTTDGGTTWNLLPMPTIAPPYIYYATAINFTDVQTGFAVGAKIDTTNFTIVGAMLKTTNAGQNWTDISTAANNDTLQNNRSLSSVKFVNSHVGYTTGQNGKVLKTTNAGGLTTGIVSVINKANEMYIYPNPFSSQTTLQAGNICKDATLTVYNSFGQQVKQNKKYQWTNHHFVP